MTTSDTEDRTSSPGEGVWKERKDAQGALERYLTDMPSGCSVASGDDLLYADPICRYRRVRARAAR